MTKIVDVKNTNKQHRSRLSTSEKLAIWITEHVGTMNFFYLIFCWTAFWLLWNSFSAHPFDPAPNFLMWLFISNMLQIFLMPLIMIGQNLQGKHAELLAENDYEVNTKAEEEIEKLNQKIDYLITLMEKKGNVNEV